MSEYYILEGKETRRIGDVNEWITAYGNSKAKVGWDEVGDVSVYTMFLGLDYNKQGGLPLLFETIIYGGKHDLYTALYSTWDEAVEGHKKACDLIKSATV